MADNLRGGSTIGGHLAWHRGNMGSGVITAADINLDGALTATGGVDSLTTATTAVSVSASTAPTNGQVLTATSSTTATWQDSSGGSILDLVYPIGAIYMSTANTSPQALLGGTWASISTGQVLLSQNASYAAGTTGGSKDAIAVTHGHSASFTGSAMGTHNHSANFVGTLMASHYHGITVYVDSTTNGPRLKGDNSSSTQGTQNTAGKSAGTPAGTVTNVAASAGTPSGSVAVVNGGASGTDKNMQPYLSVYMWKRTA